MFMRLGPGLHTYRLTPSTLDLTESRQPLIAALPRRSRHSLGVRIWRPVQTKEAGWDFDYEGVSQVGSFGSAGIRAWTFASDTGYSLPTLPLKPRFSVKADVSSGDDPRRNTLGTFNPVFPLGN